MASHTTQPSALPISCLEPSPTNPRTVFDPPKLAQLADTFRTQGVLQKLLVRPWPGRAGVFEIVDGERRWRAAQLGGLAELPVDVRPLSDAQVVEIQLIAGETGEPLSALDEAAGFQRALALRDPATGEACFTLRSLGEKLGCDFQHIQQRVALLKLPAAVRAKIAAAELAPGTAYLLVRIPDKAARDEAIREIVFPSHRDLPLTRAEAEAIIHERYMVTLRTAPFDLGDATLPGPEGAALACGVCPLKSGNDPERFSDVKEKNTCTNPACFRAKCAAAWDRTAGKAKAAGRRVLTEEEAADVFDKNSPKPEIAYSSAYVAVDAKPTYRHVANEVEDKNLPTWRELIDAAREKKGIEVPVVVACDRTGKPWELVQLTLAVEAARATGEDIFKPVASAETLNPKDRFERDSVRAAIRSTDNFARRWKEEATGAKRRAAENARALAGLHDALSLKALGHEGITAAVFPVALAHAGVDGRGLFAMAFELQKGTNSEADVAAAITAWFEKRTRSDKHAAIPVLLIALDVRWNGLKSAGFVALAAEVGYEVKAEAPAAPKAVGRAKKKKAAK